jgi:hypothetical protein
LNDLDHEGQVAFLQLVLIAGTRRTYGALVKSTAAFLRQQPGAHFLARMVCPNGCHAA